MGADYITLECQRAPMMEYISEVLDTRLGESDEEPSGRVSILKHCLNVSGMVSHKHQGGVQTLKNKSLGIFLRSSEGPSKCLSIAPPPRNTSLRVKIFPRNYKEFSEGKIMSQSSGFVSKEEKTDQGISDIANSRILPVPCEIKTEKLIPIKEHIFFNTFYEELCGRCTILNLLFFKFSCQNLGILQV